MTTWWINGTLQPHGAAVVYADDHGLTVGDGVFETIELSDGEPFAARRHLNRLRASAAGLGLTIPYDDAGLRAAITETIEAAGLLQGRIRLTVTAGRGPLGSGRVGAATTTSSPTVLVAVEYSADRRETASVCIVPWPRNERGATVGLKTTSYAENVIALAEAQRCGADEAVFANLAGQLCEATGSNVFIVRAGELVTPPLSSGCLAGVTRALLLEITDASESDISLEEFRGAEEAFLSSTTRHVQPIARIDGAALRRVAGQLTVAAARAFAELRATRRDP